MARNRRGAIRCAWPALLALVGAGSAEAAGVVGNGTPGSCTEAALNTALGGGGTVTFNCGASPVVIPLTSQKVIATATTVDGGNADIIILDGGGVTRHFTTNQLIPLTVRNLTLRNGRCLNPDPGQPSPGYGGSIRSGIASPLTVTDSRFINNVCDVAGIDVGGGAIRQRRGALLVQRTLFQGNRAGNAGAISSSDSVATVEDSTFTGNTTNAHTGGFSGVGGGFYNDESGNGLITIRRTAFINNTATFAAGAVQSFFVPGDQGLVLEDCTFQGNSSGDAGAVLAQMGPLTVTGSTFSGNSGVNGGGLYINTSPTTITNSTFSGNTATGVGGGFFAGNSTLTLSHVTIANNTAGAAGGGMAFSGSSGGLRGSIIAGNSATGGQCNVALTNAGFNVQFPGPASCAAGALVADPLLSPLASNGGLTQTRAIASGSPARNLVTSGCPPPTTDQRGVARPAGACDAGAFELSGSISIASASMAEGTGVNPTLNLGLTLSPASTQPVTVAFATANVTAVASADYLAASGTVTFPPGTTSRTIGVTLLADAYDENDEAFAVTLSNPVGATLGTATATGTILDDDAAPQMAIGDCAVLEGGLCGLAVALSAPSGLPVTVNYATAGGTATSGVDFAPASGVLLFPPLATAAVAYVQTLGDSLDEVDETLLVNLTGAANATVTDGQGTTFIDDDDGPLVTVGDVSTGEGSSATFTVALHAVSPQTVTVDYATSDGTATAGSDYVTASGTLTFSPGVLTRQATVTVNGDGVNEPDERYFFNLSDATDATVGDPYAVGTIADDDGGVIQVRGLAHGARARDGFAGGADLYSMDVPARTSWEVVVDEASGDASNGGPLLQRVGTDTTSVLQSSSAAGTGTARTLSWRNTTGLPQLAYVRVASSQCTTGCGPDDTYRVRAYETTLQVPRFNNGGNQVTILVLQNPSSATISGTAYFWGTAGALLGQQSFTLAARASTTVATSSVAGVAGQAGSITIAHDGRYGVLTGKAVALESATGFSFDAGAAPKIR